MIQPSQQLLHAAQEIAPSQVLATHLNVKTVKALTSASVKKQSRLEQFLPPKTYRVVKRLQEQRVEEQ